jgi:TPP-dependent trihydroxycyclohexane-1,2-dione (THcHDO) dehydratase
LGDIKNLKERENKKFDSISSDFKNQKGLMEINYTDKIQTLEGIKSERINTIASLNSKIEEMKLEHLSKIDQKTKISMQIKNNMDELSKFFSDQLSEIQNNLKSQINTITDKWGNNITEHLKRYEDHVKKYVDKDNK